jgi:hypothetical protein
MDNQNNNQPQMDNSDQYTLTEQQVKNYGFTSKIKYWLAAIEPGLARVFNTIIYWSLKIMKSTVTIVFKMIMGKEV